MRRTFVCLGDAVNLVGAPDVGGAGRSDLRLARRSATTPATAFVWEPLPSLTVKGKAEPVEVYALTGAIARTSRRQDALRAAARRAAGRARARSTPRSTPRVPGERAGRRHRGRGRDGQVAARRRVRPRRAPARGLLVAFGECQAFGTTTELLRLARDLARPVRRRRSGDSRGRASAARVEAALERSTPRSSPRAPLLGPVLGVPIPDNELTAPFDPKLRKASLEDLLVALPAARGPTRAARDRARGLPLDRRAVARSARGRWSARRRDAARAASCSPTGRRPRPAAGSASSACRSSREIALAAARRRRDRGQLIRSKLAQLIGATTPTTPDALVELIAARAEGNPFYVEELLNYLVGQGHRPGRRRARSPALELPESLHSLILSRIDTLDEAPRRTLKVASVVGRVVPGAGPAARLPGARRARRTSREQLDALRSARPGRAGPRGGPGLPLQARRDPGGRVREHAVRAAGDAPRARRRVHRGDRGGRRSTASSTCSPTTTGTARTRTKKREYLVRAGERRAGELRERGGDRLLRAARPAARGRRARRDAPAQARRRSLELVGDWRRAEESRARGARARRRSGRPRRPGLWPRRHSPSGAQAGPVRRGDRPAGRGRTAFSRPLEDEAGVGQVLHLAGTLAAQRRATTRARASVRGEPGDPRAPRRQGRHGARCSNLAIVAEYRGDYDEPAAAQRAGARDPDRARRPLGDRRVQNNLGMIAVQEGRFQEARDAVRAAIRLLPRGRRRLDGRDRPEQPRQRRARPRRSPAARSHYAASLRAYRDYDDRWAIAYLLEDIAGHWAAGTARATRHSACSGLPRPSG